MNTLTDLLSSRVKAEIFRLLFGLDARELHTREIARRAHLNDATVRQELKRLTRIGVVVSREDGNRVCSRANTAHPLYPDIRNLVLKTSGVAEVIRELLEGLNIRSAFIFGSLAAGAEKVGSDIDLMLIGTLTLRELTKRLSGVALRLGRELNPHILRPEEFRKRKGEGDHFLKTVLRGPKLFVIGDELELASMA